MSLVHTLVTIQLALQHGGTTARRKASIKETGGAGGGVVLQMR